MSKSIPRSASCSPYALRRPRTRTALTAGTAVREVSRRGSQLDRVGAGGREADMLAGQREDDLAAVRLVADDDDRLGVGCRDGAHLLDAGARREAVVDLELDA